MSGYLLPRLDVESAREQLHELVVARERGQDLVQLVRFSHPKATASPTGGQVVPVEQLKRLRVAVVDEVERVGAARDHRRPAAELHAEYGLSVGVALARNLDVVVSDAAHYQGWAFLALCVLPDVVAHRWPDLQEDRFVGARRDRNYLKVCWHRWQLLGDLFTEGLPALGEDQLVQLTERTAVARNRRLVRQLACAVMAYRGADRSGFARALMKRAAYWTGPSIVDLWTERTLERRVSELVDELTVLEHAQRASAVSSY